MKFLVYILLMLVSVLSPAIAQETPSRLEQANQFYSEGKYQEAVKAYEEILSTNIESPELYFNLGNAFYKTGQVSKAILNYERACLLNPNDEDIIYNLELVNQHVVDKIEALPVPFFIRWKNNVIDSKSSDTWGYYSLVSFILFLVLLGIFLFTQSVALKRFSFWFGIFTIAYSLITYSFALSQKKKITGRNQAIVFSPSITVKASPDESGSELFIIHEGLKVKITDTLNTWSEIQLSDGNKGWLPDSCLVRI